MEHQERATTSHLSKEEDGSQPSGETHLGQPEAQSQSGVCQDQRKPGARVNDWEFQQSHKEALHMEFQDSNLSPALPLLPVASEVEHNFTEYSFSQQSNPDFVPLRAYPDVSVASERFGVPPQDCTAHSMEHSSLSQYPLTQATILSEEKAGSCFTPSQHSLSSENKTSEKEMSQLSAITDNEPGIQSQECAGSRERESEAQTNLTDKQTSGIVDDEIFFLRKDVPAQHLLNLLQKEVGLRSSSSGSAVSSELQSSTEGTDESKNAEGGKPFPDKSLVKRAGPPGEASLFHKQTEQSDQSGALSSEISNITTGSRSTQPDESSELLHRQLLSEAQTLSRLQAERNKKQQIVLTPSGQLFTPSLRNVSERKPSGNTNLASLQWMGSSSPGAECTHKEQNLLSQSQTAYDGSYLTFLPQSQSTPGVGIAQLEPNVRTKFGQLSAIESEKENLNQSSTGISPQPASPKVDAHLPDEANRCDKDAPQTSAEVQFLPSLNYLQKINAWRAKQNNSPALEELDGISSKTKADDAASNPFNQTLTQKAGPLQRPSVTGAATHSSSSAPSGSSWPRRGEAVGSAPCDRDNRGSAAPPSPFGRSQSHSSLSTVVTSINKHQQTDAPPEEERTQSQDDAPHHHHHHHHSSAAVQPSPVVNLGHFSDVSFDQTLSSSQGSYSEVKVVASVGTSSVVSLELDHYAPYWTSKHSTPPPPKSQELNIDERIPLYLQNLGIDQTPSKILTPFAPRGPIREPEFSPTDLVTIKGSTGTPSRSTQPSEGGSPHKEEFSRSSILSVGSNVSVPFSLDSLGQAVSVPEQVRARMASPSDTEAIQSESRLAPGSQPHEGFQFSLQPSQQQRDGRRAVSQPANRPDADTSLTFKSRVVENGSNSPFQSSQSVDEDAEKSFVSANAVSEIRKLLSHAENIISTGSSAASSAALPNQLFSHEDIFKSPHPKTSRLQNASFASSSADGDLRTRSSLLWTRSSSDSMLALEKTRQTSVGHESMSSSHQTDNSSTHAAAALPYNVPQASAAGSNVETSLAIAKSARRTEPEGCSAVPPDNIPTQHQVMKPLPASSKQQPNSPSSDRGGVSEEEDSSSRPDAQSRSSSSVIEDAAQEPMSDGSSESSLTLRVAKLLQSESPATVMSSTPSVTEQEENKTNEWLKLNVLRQQCEPQQLSTEDRERIEEIKKELLLRNPLKSQSSTDTESSASSSLQTNKALSPPQSVKMFFTLTDVDNQHRLSLRYPESHTQPQSTHHSDLEALVCEIAAREGVTLATKQPRTFTSITSSAHITTSPSPSTSSAPPVSQAPLPLHITELSTEPNTPAVTSQSFPPHMDEGEDEVAALAQTNREQPSVSEAGNSFQSRNQSVTSQSSLKIFRLDLDKTDANIRPDSAPSFSHHEESSNHTSFVSGVAQKPDQAAGPGPTARPGHVSNVHPSLCSKAADHTSASAAKSAPPDAAAGLPQQLFVTPRDPAPAASSPDEGVGSSSPPEWYHREPEPSDPFNTFQTIVAQRRATAAATQSLTQAGSRTAGTPVPVLLPYKPRGSEELFYVPQTEADVSSAEQSDTTMESTHTGSDDAVPPHFSSDVLGSKDPGLDRGVTFRHAEGIYSKRLKAVTFKMQSPELRVNTSTTFTRAPPQNHKVSTRDQGTSPVQYPQYRPPETNHERFHRLHVETVQPSVSQSRGEPDLPQLDSTQSSRTLDHLWQRFCSQWTAEVSRPARDREASLLMRLERLSRLLHHTKSDAQEGRGYDAAEPLRRTQRSRGAHQEVIKCDVFTEAKGTVREPHVHRGLQVGENDGHASSSSHSSSQTPHLSPADRDESETSSAVSGSMSTVDTARLIRAYGPHRVQQLKSSSSLSKLYGTINRQQQRERHTDQLHDIAASHTGTDQSVAPDSSSSAASSSSSSTVPSHHGPSRALTVKRKVKLVSKSVQTGGLEIVKNGTRRHTRDVGTTFPSPGEARASGQISSSSFSTVRGRGGRVSPSAAHSNQMQRKKRSPSEPYPNGVSWFISADSLRSEARKENHPAACWSRSTAWFEPYNRGSPWRAPLRQKQLHEDRDHQSRLTDPPDPAPKTRTVSSGLARVSLQESLELHRPEFISRSRRRLLHLALQVEERRLQADFIRERNLSNQPGRPARLPKPAGTALLKRAVPRKEMIQRSKQIYETLPEVRERREEERRKAEYQSYRLNAQLYNKRITNHVLGRRAAWH